MAVNMEYPNTITPMPVIDPFDITLDMLAYDWREATNHWDAPSKRIARGEPPLGQEGQAKYHAVDATHAPPLPLPLATVTSTSFSSTEPLHAPRWGPSKNLPVRASTEAGARGARHQPLGAPQEPAPSETAAIKAETQDAAAIMLETLQSKLSCIQKSVKAMPLTGYAPQSRVKIEAPAKPVPAKPQPVEPRAPCFEDFDILDEDFVALVGCPISSASATPQAETPGRKRKAGD